MRVLIFAVSLFLSQAAVAADLYEYKVMILRLLNTTEAKQNSILNEQAAEGWRLVSTHIDSANNTVIYLERPKR